MCFIIEINLLIFGFLIYERVLITIIYSSGCFDECELYFGILSKNVIRIDDSLFWFYYTIRGWILEIRCKFIFNQNFKSFSVFVFIFQWWIYKIYKN